MAFCGNCGTRIPAGATCCPSCGADLSPEEVVLAPKKRRRKKIAILAALLLILAVGVTAALTRVLRTEEEKPYKVLSDRWFYLHNGDVELLEQMLPPEAWTRLAKTFRFKTVEECVAALKEIYREYKDDSVTDYSSALSEDRLLSREELAGLVEDLHRDYRFITSESLTEARWLELDQSWKENGVEHKEFSYMGVALINGVWYPLPARENGNVAPFLLAYSKYSDQLNG